MIRLLSILLFLPSFADAACDFVTNGDLVIEDVTALTLGKFTTPDSVSSSVAINAVDGSRTLAPELNINDQNRTTFGDDFAAAEISVTGGPNCHFRISVVSQTVSPDSITFYSDRSVSGTGPSPIIELDGSGVAEVRLGAIFPVSSTTTTADVTGTLQVEVTYVDDPTP